MILANVGDLILLMMVHHCQFIPCCNDLGLGSIRYYVYVYINVIIYIIYVSNETLRKQYGVDHVYVHALKHVTLLMFDSCLSDVQSWVNFGYLIGI